MLGQEQPAGPTCTAVPLQEELLATTRLHLCLPGYPGIQHEKTVAYTRALQFWVEKANLPTGGKPCLLWGSVIELQKEMECYLSFSNEDVFKGMALQEETPTIPPKGATPHSTKPTPSWHPHKGSYHRDDCGTPCRKETSEQVPWLGESATSLQTHSCCQRDFPLIERPKEKAP